MRSVLLLWLVACSSPTAAPSSDGADPPPLGGAGCGFDHAAFCDTFDTPSTSGGRAGELDAARWSAGRVAPQGPTDKGGVFPVGAAMIPACRAGLPSQVFPDQDSLICDPSSDIGSHYLLTAVAAQNYGSNSYRVRQPFDFAGRTGTIVFDGAASPYGGLFGWLSVEVTEDPIAAPSFENFLNDEGGVLPRNAFEVQFAGSCGGSGEDATGVGITDLHVYTNYQDARITPPAGTGCASYRAGKLNHYEIQISQTSVEVRVSPFSDDGVTFGAPTLVYQSPVSIPFSRGYVHFTAHNHATLKYSNTMGVVGTFDASIALWDNAGFDGPVISTAREYEVPDALVSVSGFHSIVAPVDPYNPSGTVMNLGYVVPDVAAGPAQALHLAGVDLTNATSARVALTVWYLAGPDNARYALRLRWNGGAWRDHPLSSDEAALLTGPPGIQGALGQMIDVSRDDLVSGDNTLEIVAVNVPQNYPPAVANVDLIVSAP